MKDLYKIFNCIKKPEYWNNIKLSYKNNGIFKDVL